MKRRESYGTIIDDLMELVADGLQDRYTIDGLLGAGGMAVVFAAQDLERRRPVAIKVLKPDVANEVATTRFLREILWSSSFQHPHIVPVLHSGEVAGYPYLVMPLIEGDTLAERLAAQSRLPVAVAIKYATDVASALDYAHRKGIVHRDIKPDNILISDDFAMVADFGISRALGLASGNTLTAAGSAIGTLAYMSPEQEEGRRDVDGRSDIYSLGCVTYEMLAGRRPFDGTTFGQILQQKRDGRPPTLDTLCPELPAEITRAVARALENDRDLRFPAAREFADALGAARLPPVRVEPVRARSRPGIWLLAAAVIAVVVLVVILLRR